MQVAFSALKIYSWKQVKRKARYVYAHLSSGFCFDERWTITKRTPNVRNVRATKTQRLHNVPSSTLLNAQSFEHVQNQKLASAFFSEHQRPWNEHSTITTHDKRVTNEWWRSRTCTQLFEHVGHTLAQNACMWLLHDTDNV